MRFDYNGTLRQSSERMVVSYAILNTLQESVFLMDDRFKLTWFNRACDELYYQLTQKRITENFDFNELLTIKQHTPFRHYFHKAMAGEPAEFEWYYNRFVSKWLSVSLIAFSDGSGFSGVCGTIRDITERKLTDQVLLRNTSVLNNIEQGVVLTDASFKIIAFNSRAREIAGEWGAILEIGLEAVNYLPPDRRAIATKKHATALRGVSAEYEARYPNNKWFLINFQPVKNKGGRIKQVSVTYKDITEEKKVMEERLRIEIELQREITRVALETQEDARNQLGRELHDNISQILAAANMQVGHCLAYYEEGKPLLENVQDNLREAIQELRKLSHRMVMPRFAESHLNDKLKKLLDNYNNGQVISLDTCGWTEENIPVFIKETFFRVAQEQLNNINKYAQANEIVVHIENTQHEASMSIKDNGVGFDTGKERTGIGISNIFSRVELYNGTTRIVSAPGKGCVLSINIPLPTRS